MQNIRTLLELSSGKPADLHSYVFGHGHTASTALCPRVGLNRKSVADNMRSGFCNRIDLGSFQNSQCSYARDRVHLTGMSRFSQGGFDALAILPLRGKPRLAQRLLHVVVVA